MKLTHPLVFGIVIVLLSGCKSKVKMPESKPAAYRLAESPSLYLQQHAANPVAWFPWGDEALQRAVAEDKLLIISVGYSSCHWCHVMEHESFEDTAVAGLMNAHFVSIKVDREERPDIDQVYMNAVQLMTGRGGWPMNVVALPDGRPIWGGTYFPKDDWMGHLEQLADLYANDRDRVLEYAQNLARGVQQLDLVPPNKADQHFHSDSLHERVTTWARSLDYDHGGPNRAPKFPVPAAYRFLLQYAVVEDDSALLTQVKTTLDRMIWGGIYDQVGGGWTRYSTDPYWKVPHFEKMLYDNAQLLQLYAEGYSYFRKPNYLETMYQSLDFLEDEFRQPSGGYASALDADSEGEEGKFYIFSEEELRAIIPADEWSLFADYFSVGPDGLWEGSYILLRISSDADFCSKRSLSLSDLRDLRASWIRALKAARSQRVRPGLDQKIITSWNAMLVSGFCAVYKATAAEPSTEKTSTREELNQNPSTRNPDTLRARAVALLNYLRTEHTNEEGALLRTPGGRLAYLDDYTWIIRAALDVYEITGDEDWLDYAMQLTLYTFDHFFDEEMELFYYNSAKAEKLVSRPLETEDNVIPSSNAVMAHNLFALSRYLDRPAFEKTALQMLWNMDSQMDRHLSSYAEWGRLYHYQTAGFQEVAITGPDAENVYRNIATHYRPLELCAWSSTPSERPLLRYRYSEVKTQVFLCEHGACQLPLIGDTYIKGLVVRR